MLKEKKFSFLEHFTETERTILEDGFELHHYAIFNNRIDHSLLELIHDGSEELTDDLFFELLAEEPAYLGTVVFQQRINKWRDIYLWADLHDKKEVATAKSNLQKIGRILARSDSAPGSPKRLPDDVIRIEYLKATKFLKEFFAKAGEKPSSTLLTKTYPRWKHAFQDEAGRHEHRTVKEIALRLTLFELSQREKPVSITLKTLRKIAT